MKRIITIAAHVVLALSLLTVTGCLSTKAPPQTGVMSSMDVEITAQRIRVGAHNFAKEFMAGVELTADLIAEQTNDPGVRHNTLVWKANAIPAIQIALYHPDPFISYVEGWTLLVQMRQYFETGDGRELFGDQQHLAIDVLKDGERRIQTVVASARSETADGTIERFVYHWADEHPLTNDRFLRLSPTAAVADILGEEQLGGLGSLGSMTEMAQNSQQMALILASYAPKQIAWQSELLIADALDTTNVAPLLKAIDDMAIISATADFMTTAPQLIADERAAVFQEIGRERLAMMQDLERQRLEAQIQMTAILSAERTAIMAEIANERAMIFAEMQGLTLSAFAETRSLVDHLMLQMGLGLFGIAVLVIIGFMLLRSRSAA